MIPVNKTMRRTGGNYTGDKDNLYSAKPTMPPVDCTNFYIVNYPQELTYQYCIFKGWYEYFPETQIFRCHVEDASLCSNRMRSSIRSFDVADMPTGIPQVQYEQLREAINKIDKQIHEYDDLARRYYYGK